MSNDVFEKSQVPLRTHHGVVGELPCIVMPSRKKTRTLKQWLRVLYDFHVHIDIDPSVSIEDTVSNEVCSLYGLSEVIPKSFVLGES